jgi:hypothetical protein
MCCSNTFERPWPACDRLSVTTSLLAEFTGIAQIAERSGTHWVRQRIDDRVHYVGPSGASVLRDRIVLRAAPLTQDGGVSARYIGVDRRSPASSCVTNVFRMDPSGILSFAASKDLRAP